MRSQATLVADLNLLEVAVTAARAAVGVIRERTPDRAALDWEEKGPTDFVSAVDIAAEQRIREVIGRLLPGALIVAEEGSPDLARDTGLVFLVDPLDGTTNFLHGFAAYAVSIAVVCDGRLAAGVVHDVVSGDVCTAASGHGAWCGGERLHVSSITRPSRALIGTGIPFKAPAELPVYLPQLDRVARQTAGVRRGGSAALDLVDVARGRLEAFWELSLAPWDVAAGLLIIREAGGVVTDRQGLDAAVAAGPIVAGNPAMHRWLLAELRAADDGARLAPPAERPLAARTIVLPPSGRASGDRVALREGARAPAIIECVPNFSDGRRPEVVAAIGDAVSAVGGATVLDVSSDAWHNRSVITFAATPESAADAALAAIGEAARLIDLTTHVGVHPRLGAADVVPFVPLGSATMADCVELAHALGRRVGDELGIPVYLYEYAATRPDRRNLADVRRGGFEGLRELVGRDPERAPDYGPARL
ncbi:MAG: inositol monophosphatase family protein, partial [Gemmatimonadaceae bacterium]